MVSYFIFSQKVPILCITSLFLLAGLGLFLWLPVYPYIFLALVRVCSYYNYWALTYILVLNVRLRYMFYV